jgi:alpha-methylacyl-CoA racemase
MTEQPHAGPLRGLRVLEFAGLGPAPFASMLLADMGADVVRVERPGEVRRPKDIVTRGRTAITLDLKSERDRALALRLASKAQVLIEGFRPGVMERLGLGPAETISANPGLVYARMTGWGQSGPMADQAGHDINYIALTGALDAVGSTDGPPLPPLNLVGDYGGGATFLAIGVLAAVIEAKTSGKGQVIDCAICDGVLAVLTQFHSLCARGEWGPRGTNQYDGGAHFYTTYRCADGKYIAVGCGEPKFYAAFREGAGLSDPLFDRQRDRTLWPLLKSKTQAVIETRPRAEWLHIFEGRDACVTAVLSIEEALADEHLRARGSVVERGGVRQAAPAPRFSRTASAAREGRRLETASEALALWD